MTAQFVIIGARRAGAYATATLRPEGFSDRILLIGEEPIPPYDRPPLSKEVLIGKTAPIDCLIFKREFYEENAIDLRLGDPAAELSPQ